MFRSKKRELAVSTAEVLRQAVAIVEGRQPPGGSPAPAGQGWISRLAHTGWEDLEVLAGCQPRHAATWEGAGIYLALELREGARTAEGLVHIQRDRLIPLELEMLAGHLEPPATPADLVRLVRVSSHWPRC